MIAFFIPSCLQMIEISLFSFFFYYFLSWLNKDRNSKLLNYFYTYFLLIAITFYTDLYIFHNFLILCLPFFFFLFIIFHQQTLQKNFISFKTSDKITTGSSDWLEILIRSALFAINKSKEVVFVIEQTNELKSYLTTHFPLYTAIHLDTIAMLLESSYYNSGQMIWCSTNGIIIGFNSSWNIQQSQKNSPSAATWYQDSLLMTLKTDTIIIKADPHTRAFCMMSGGKVTENLTASQTLALINELIFYSNKQEPFVHDKKNQTNILSQ